MIEQRGIALRVLEALPQHVCLYFSFIFENFWPIRLKPGLFEKDEQNEQGNQADSAEKVEEKIEGVADW